MSAQSVIVISTRWETDDEVNSSFPSADIAGKQQAFIALELPRSLARPKVDGLLGNGEGRTGGRRE